MLAGGLAYSALVWLTMPPAARTAAGMRQAAAAIVAWAKGREVQVAASLALGAGWLSYLDGWLWGGVVLPELTRPWRSDTVLAAPAGLLLAALSLLLVNGVAIPVAEEWLWRGLVQPVISAALGSLPGLLVTSLLFSAKHAIVDASLGRALTLTVFGLIMGHTARRYGWRAAAATHSLANLIATAFALIITGGEV